MTRSSDASANSTFGSFDALTQASAERRAGGRRLEDRIAQREAEAGQQQSAIAAAAPLLGALAGAAGGADRRRPAGTDRRGRDPLAADRLDPPTARPSYARFIPREELGQVSSWNMDNFGSPKAAAAPVSEAQREAVRQQAEQAAVARAAQLAAQAAAAREQALRTAREGGYQDGYRDGLAALEAFKHAHATQTAARITAVLATFQSQLDMLEQHLAERVSGIAMEVARQVVRHELTVQPQRVVAVTREALGQMLTSARHIMIRLHPDDHAEVLNGLAELLAARHARLVSDPAIERGGCVVQSDIGVVDASVATRWARAMDGVGADLPWQAVERKADDSQPQVATPATAATPGTHPALAPAAALRDTADLGHADE